MASSRSARRSRRRWRRRRSSSSDRRQPPSGPWATRPKRGAACSRRACRSFRGPRGRSLTTCRHGPRRRGSATRCSSRRPRAAAASEAVKAFGAGEVYLEKYLERPRHVEIQILADSFGRVVALGERECSIQRRHQKLIEEAPSVAVTPALRRRMSDAATAAAGAVGYLGAGTIEFLLAPSGEFYFLEMNTRFQVEHPVTELVYGVDIVREQLRIAAGQPMRVHGAAAAGGGGGILHPRGHAIECRITAEDPLNDFLPASGVLQYLRVPSGPGVRWDGGVEAGQEVTLFYDPLLAKLIVWGETREVAIQ